MTHNGKMEVGDLRRKIEGMPDDALVYYERIEDAYFEKHGWTTEDLPDDLAPEDPTLNRKMIHAFSAWRSPDGKRLFITAHY